MENSRITDRKAVAGTARRGVYDTLQQRKPSTEPETITNRSGDTMDFDIARFHYIAKDFNKATSSVPMNRAGEALRFYPEKGWKKGRTVCFEARNELDACARHGVPTRIIRRTYASKAYSIQRARDTIR